MTDTPATVLLYHEDSYLRRFDATVVAVDGRALALDRTAFYPGGGGQMADQGALLVDGRSLPLAALRKEGDIVWHEVAPDAGDLPAVGATLSRRAGLGLPLPHDAHPHRAAPALRPDLHQLRRAGHRRADVPRPRAHGLLDGGVHPGADARYRDERQPGHRRESPDQGLSPATRARRWRFPT